MKIDRVELFALRLPLRSPFHSGGTTTDFRDLGVLRLTDEDGRTGVGEITPYPDPVAPPLDDLIAAFESGARDQLLDAEIFDHGLTLDSKLPAAVESAIDVALLDLLARREEIRVADLIGVEVQERVAVNATITAPTVDEVAELGQHAVEAGFATIKLKVGHASDDRARLEALREAVGFETLIRLDANGGWFTGEAIDHINEFQEFGLELIEQPVAPDDLASMHRVRDASLVPIIADEGVRSVEDLDLHVANGACDGVAIKLAQVGGITSASLLAGNAARAGLLTFVTSTLDGPVGLAAGLHFAAARSDFSVANGLATGGLFEESYALGLPDVVDGALELTDVPGLGIELDEDALLDLSIS
ncbi:MAG: mandelate racemase/muconate lactonizing enzyme family protein [Thermoleophilaceae bacterium]|nr:mandelate racemase/muconate lactonizing enzyme family protein [Thermoleophilaceae bacterium]